MILAQKQELFADHLNLLCRKIMDDGYRIRHGHLFRDPEWAEILEERGKGISDSLHCLKLAADLFISFGYQHGGVSWDVDDYRPYGEWWKRLSTPAAPHHWGGDFVRTDAFHFSIGHNGVR